MKAPELRVGNWFYSTAKGRNEQFEKHHFCSHNDSSVESYYIEECAEPIPLTEEWLERFGFEIECLAANDCRAVKGDFYITLDHDGSTVIGYPTSIGMRNKWMFVQDIEYVHQLQNLYFALSGEELELKP